LTTYLKYLNQEILCMVASKNVAAEVSILYMIDDCKVQIGASSKANACSSWTIKRRYTNW
jgi:hypothetical protein